VFHDFIEREHKFSRLFGRDDTRERLLDQLCGAEAEQFEDRIVGLQDFTLEVRDKKRVRRVRDDDFRV
jgi:hypothetical protein